MLLKSLIQMTREMVGSEFLYFSTELKVKQAPHSKEVYLWGICIGPHDTVHVMDADQQWHDINEEKDGLIIQSLFQRLRFIHQTMFTKAELEGDRL